MIRTDVERLVEDAKLAGILPASATAIGQDDRPWPVVLLTALGAWLAAIPLFGVITTLLGATLADGLALYVVGGLLLVASLVTLRSRTVGLFTEQLAVPGLLVAGISLGMGLFGDLMPQAACALVAALALTAAVLVPQAWLRVLLGFAAGGFMMAALVPGPWYSSKSTKLFASLAAIYVAVALGACAHVVLERGTAGRKASTLESIFSGWVVSIFAACALWAGFSLLGSSGLHSASAWGLPFSMISLMKASSVIPALCAGAWVLRQWPSTRQPWLFGVGLVLVCLAWMMPSLGAVLLVIAMCATTRRWMLTAAGAVAAAWILGSFYYQLSFPLAVKAAMLVAAAALLGAMAWLGRERRSEASHAAAPGPVNGRRLGIGIGAALVAVLAVANIGIYKNETLIETGQPVFVELAPVDPRSLMQGDYMRLNFRLPGDTDMRSLPLAGAKRPQVVARKDARGVANLLRVHGEGAMLAEGEFLVELTPKDGRWTLVTDAWFFKEGEASRWDKAKYGEFRVLPNGKALLVDLRGPSLEKL